MTTPQALAASRSSHSSSPACSCRRSRASRRCPSPGTPAACRWRATRRHVSLVVGHVGVAVAVALAARAAWRRSSPARGCAARRPGRARRRGTARSAFASARVEEAQRRDVVDPRQDELAGHRVPVAGVRRARRSRGSGRASAASCRAAGAAGSRGSGGSSPRLLGQVAPARANDRAPLLSAPAACQRARRQPAAPPTMRQQRPGRERRRPHDEVVGRLLEAARLAVGAAQVEEDARGAVEQEHGRQRGQHGASPPARRRRRPPPPRSARARATTGVHIHLLPNEPP